MRIYKYANCPYARCSIMQTSPMSKTEQYAFQCRLAVRNQQEQLHVEVRSRKFAEQSYSRHFAYADLSDHLRLIFRNIAQLFAFMQRKELVYFDEEETALKLCPTIAGETKQFAIPLQPLAPSRAAAQKIAYYQAERTKKREEFELAKSEKEEAIEELRKCLEQARQERTIEEQEVKALQTQCLHIGAELFQMKVECESRMQAVRSMNPNEAYNSVASVKQLKRREEKREFWIKEIAKIKSQKLMPLKGYINKEADFEVQTSLKLSALQLSKMQFVEIFFNLQELDLSRNHISSLQGLQGLKQLLKLNLNDNRLTKLSGIPQLPLVELHLKSNSIRRIENIFHLTRLQILNLSFNCIQTIPDQIAKLNRLVQLRLYRNLITTITQKLLLLTKIRVFSIMKNKCYNQGSRSRELIDRMLKNGVQTAIAEAEEIHILV